MISFSGALNWICSCPGISDDRLPKLRAEAHVPIPDRLNLAYKLFYPVTLWSEDAPKRLSD
ncbi:hypothetical protein GCM10010136_25570 [Limoniibacter endophyticus]|uniref:Uncharacterized protein n=1 Tax=Limoniibacter endophyticus TaxID=1565040 RepID=A0A8J3DRM8_9HYPH|nr:hypothetical protein GCM10010136_25570 [Limoniibacter endophyticus]